MSNKFTIPAILLTVGITISAISALAQQPDDSQQLAHLMQKQTRLTSDLRETQSDITTLQGQEEDLEDAQKKQKTVISSGKLTGQLLAEAKSALVIMQNSLRTAQATITKLNKKQSDRQSRLQKITQKIRQLKDTTTHTTMHSQNSHPQTSQASHRKSSSPSEQPQKEKSGKKEKA